MYRCRSLICWLVFAVAPAWAQDAAELAQQHCARCHGIDGIATQPGTPHLNGQVETYLVDVLSRFQKGRQPTALVEHVPQTLAAAQIEAIARHYTGAKATRPKQSTDPDKVARGEIVYAKRCIDCHADNGRGDADNDSPLIAAQDLDYLQEQNRQFVAGKRKFGYLQDKAFKGLSQEELESAAHFFASQEQLAPRTSGRKKRR